MNAPRGLYHGRGWVVDVGADAEADVVLVASIHEAMHERLELTTMYGNLVQLVSRVQAGGRDSETLRGILASANQVQEEFATWMSCVPTGWTGDRLRDAFPAYERHLRNAQRRVAGLDNPYIAMHAIQAVARTSMQSTELADRVVRPLDDLRPADLSRTMRPDWRVRQLEKALTRRGWGPVAAYMGPASDLSVQWFEPAHDDQWDTTNRLAYDWCADLLARAGCPTLPYDGHISYSRAAQARLVDQRRPAPPTQSTDQALFAVESETMVLGDPIPLRIHPRGTPVEEMLSGELARAHLFLAIRPADRVRSQYRILNGELPFRRNLALLRCQADDTVEVLDVSDHDPASLAAGRAVVVSISMRSLAEPGIRHRWAPLLGSEQATVLCDLRPSTHLRDWLAGSDLWLRYAVVGTQTKVGWVRTLVFRLEDAEGGRSRTHLAPVSRLYATALQLWLTEHTDLAGRVFRDDTLAEGPLMRFTAAHVMLEERIFDFHAGD